MGKRKLRKDFARRIGLAKHSVISNKGVVRLIAREYALLSMPYCIKSDKVNAILNEGADE